MSDSERPEIRAFEELEGLVRHLGEELAVFRRRALTAETQLREGGSAPAKSRSGATDRAVALELENDALRTRLARAEDRVQQMMERVRFLRQQLQADGAVGAGGGRA